MVDGGGPEGISHCDPHAPASARARSTSARSCRAGLTPGDDRICALARLKFHHVRAMLLPLRKHPCARGRVNDPRRTFIKLLQPPPPASRKQHWAISYPNGSPSRALAAGPCQCRDRRAWRSSAHRYLSTFGHGSTFTGSFRCAPNWSRLPQQRAGDAGPGQGLIARNQAAFAADSTRLQKTDLLNAG
jgi:hypothetical protein